MSSKPNYLQSRLAVVVLFGTTRSSTVLMRTTSVVSLFHSVLEKCLVPLKAEFEWLKEVSSVIFQQPSRY